MKTSSQPLSLSRHPSVTAFNFRRSLAAFRAAVCFGAVALTLPMLTNAARAGSVTNLINVQYRGSATNPNNLPAGGQGTTYSGAAVVGSVGDTWNQEQIGYYYQSPNPYFNGVALVNSSNSASGLTLTLGFNGSNPIQGANLVGTATDAATTNLTGAAIYIFSVNGAGTPSFTTTHTIGGLSSYAGATANLIVYAAAPSAQAEQIAITGGASGGNSGSTLSTSSTDRKISGGAGDAYQIFTNVTLTGGNLVFTVGNSTAANFSNAGYVNGFQLQIIQTISDPGITTQPTSKAGFVGGPATFSVTPSGTAPFSYQWQATNSAAGGFTNLVNGGQIAGATTNTLTLSNLTTNNALTYRVVVTNVNGSITSSVASLSVISQELIDVDVGGSTVQTGAAVLGASTDVAWNSYSSVGASSLSNLKDSSGNTLTGVGLNVSSGLAYGNDTTSSTLDAATTPLMQDFLYNSTGLTVSYTGLAFNNYPYQLVVYAAGTSYDGSQSATVSVTAGSTGTTPASGVVTSASRKISAGVGVAYQSFTGTVTNSTLTFAVAQHSSGGINLNGMQLLVQDPYLIIASQPVSVTNAAGSTVNFSVSATGAALSYQWQATNNSTGFTNIPGATSSTLTLTAASGSSPVNYQVVVSNSFSGSVTSSVASLSLTPHISTQPLALQATTVGGSTSLSVVADGSPTVTYQWQATNNVNGFTNVPNTAPFSGATSSTLSISSATANQALTYQVVVANSYGSVTSTPSVLTVSSSPVITVQPLSQTNNAGTTVNFTVTATGTAPLAYQWQANGGSGYTNLSSTGSFSGANTNTLTITSIADANALSYQVIITNSSGAITSSPATLTVIDPPVIGASPASQSVNVGSTVNFTVTTSSGTAPFTYQWQTNGVNLGNGGIVSGATTSTLTLTGVTTNYALNYTVVVSNPAGSVTSSPAATLSVHIPPSIVTQPSSPVVSPGATATFSVAAAGDPTLVYQWQSGPAGGPFTNLTDNGQISGSSTSTLTITNANTPVAISYQVVVNNSYGSVTSSVASLTLGKLIDVDIGSTANVQSGAAVLGASGDVWNGVTGSQGGIVDSASNLLSGVSFADSGYFGFNDQPNGSPHTALDAATTALMRDCVFGFVGNSPSSFPVSLSGLSAYKGDTFTLVVYSGVGDPGQGANLTLAGATGGNTASTLGVSADTRQISAGIGHAYNTFTGTITNGTLTITASPNVNPTFFGINGFQLLINFPDPTITTNPVSLTKVVGATATFSVAATGSATLSYQWQATNSASGGFTNVTDVSGVISGSATSTLTLTNVTASEALTYQVVVSNGSGSVTSTPASLNVLTIPIINTQPASQTVLSGSTVTFTVGATGIGTLGYQWQTNGVNVTDGGIISGSATSALTLAGVTTNNAVSYQVVVTNANGSVTSSPAILTVLPATELINVDIGSTANVQSGAAVLGASGDVWNGVTGSQGGIVDSASNLLSGVSFADSGYFGFNDQPNGSPHTALDAATTALMRDCVFGFVGNSPSSFPVSLSGLSAYNGEAFTLVVYSGVGDPGQGANLTLAGATGGNTASTLGVSADTRQISAGIGHAYNTFTGTITNGTLTITASPDVNPTFFGINGFQLLLAPTVPPVITSAPASRTNYVGDTATFSVGAVTSSGSLSYQWQANGTNLTDGGIVSGSATSTLTLTGVTTNSALPYQVIVSNGSGSVTSSVANLTVFTVPVAGSSFTLGVTLGVPQTVQIIGGKYAPSNADNLPLTITSVTGATNGTVSTDGTNITYTATNTTAGATNDSFTYTVSDGHSGTASQTVSVTISPAVQGFNNISAQLVGGNEVLTYLGIPGLNYALDWTHSLTQPIVWTPVLTNPAAGNGYLIFTNTPSGGSDFYRTRYVP